VEFGAVAVLTQREVASGLLEERPFPLTYTLPSVMIQRLAEAAMMKS